MEIEQKHIDALIKNPSFRKNFDLLYGEGSSNEFVDNNGLSDTFREDDSLNTLPEEEKEGRGLITDTVVQTAGGLVDAFKSTVGLVEDLGDTISEKTNFYSFIDPDPEATGIDKLITTNEEAKEQNLKDPFFGYIDQDDTYVKDKLNVPEADTMLGAFIRPVSQFVGGVVMGGKALKGVKAVTTSGKIAKSLSVGAIADFTAFDEHTGNLSSMIEGTFLENPVTEFLATNEDDHWAEARFKNALEGAFIGGTFEGIFQGFRRWRTLKKSREEGNVEEFKKKEKKSTAELNKVVKELYEEKSSKKLNPRKKKKIREQGKEELDRLNAKNYDDDLLRLEKSLIAFRKGEINPATKKKWKLEELLDETWGSGTWVKGSGTNVIDILNRVKSTLNKSKIKPKRNNEETLRLAEKLGRNPEKVTNSILRLSDEIIDSEVSILSAQMVEIGMADALTEVAKKVQLGTAKEEDFFALMNALQNVAHSTDNVVSQSAKNLQIRTVEVPNSVNPNKIFKLMKKLEFRPTKETRKEIVAKVSQLDNTFSRSVFMRGLRFIGNNKPVDMLNELWINAILSSPKTHMINMTSNLFQTLITPLEMAVGAVPQLLKGDTVAFREAIDVYVGLAKYLSDSYKLSKLSLKEGKNFLEVENLNKVELGDNKAIPNALGGGAIRLPSRFLQAEDEFFKQINYRAKHYAFSVGQVRMKNQGKNLSKDDFAKKVQEEFDAGFDVNGRATDKGKYALDYAQDNTFTRSLNEMIDNGFINTGGKQRRSIIGGNLQRMTTELPILKQIIPFVRTPVNIARNVWERTPLLNLFMQEHRNALKSANPSVQAQAMGKWAIGSAFYGTAYALANGGKITGGGSKDPQIKKQQLATGWRPYSFKVGDEYISFERLDPWGMFFGLLGDYNEMADLVDDQQLNDMAQMQMFALLHTMDGGELISPEDLMETKSTTGKKVSRGISVVAKNLTSKTYLKGLSDFIGMLEAGNDWEVERVLKSKTGSFIPNVIKKLIGDPYYREVRTYMDSIKAGLPYFNETLEPKYDYKGEILERSGSYLDNLVFPITKSKTVNDKIALEISSLNFRFQPVDNLVGAKNTVDLLNFKNKEGKTAFLKYNEIIGTMSMGIPERTLREAFEDLFKSNTYQNAEPPMRGSQFTVKGGKVELIQNLLDMYRERALVNLQNEKGFLDKNGLSLKKTMNVNKRGVDMLKTTTAEDYLYNN